LLLHFKDVASTDRASKEVIKEKGKIVHIPQPLKDGRSQFNVSI